MKKLVLLVLLAGAGWFGYRFVVRMQQESCYKKVADAWAVGQTDEALRYAEGDAVRKSLEEHTLRSLVDGRMIEAWRGGRLHDRVFVEGRRRRCRVGGETEAGLRSAGHYHRDRGRDVGVVSSQREAAPHERRLEGRRIHSEVSRLRADSPPIG